MMKRSKKVIFTKTRNYLKIDEIDVDKILVSKNEPCGTKLWLKYFVGYNKNDVIRPLYIKLLQMISYIKCFDSNRTVSFKVIDNKLLRKYIWERVSSLMNIEFDSEPVYGDNDKYIKTKVKSYIWI